jgi:hypothetical protein
MVACVEAHQDGRANVPSVILTQANYWDRGRPARNEREARKSLRN